MAPDGVLVPCLCPAQPIQSASGYKFRIFSVLICFRLGSGWVLGWGMSSAPRANLKHSQVQEACQAGLVPGRKGIDGDKRGWR